MRILPLFIILGSLASAQTLLQQNYDTRSYNFSLTNGSGVSGNLSASGAGKVLTFTRRPFGLVTGNSVRLSGGTGTAEAVAITATSGTAGAAGTITVTTGNTHTGSWIASSPNGGIGEAVTVALAARGGVIFLPPDNIPLYAPITGSVVGGKTLTFMGSGPAAGTANYGTVIYNTVAGQPAFNITADVTAGRVQFEKFQLLGFSTTGDGIYCNGCFNMVIRDVHQALTGAMGLHCVGCIDGAVYDSEFSQNATFGMQFAPGGGGGGGNTIQHNKAYSNCYNSPGVPCAGINVSNSLGASIINNDVEGTGTTGVVAAPSTGFGIWLGSAFGSIVKANYGERNLTHCIYLGSNVNGFDVSGNYCEESGIFADSGAGTPPINGAIFGNYLTNVTNTNLTVTGAVDNGSGFCRITTSTAHNLTNTAMVYLNAVGGTGCNGPGLIITAGSATQFDVTLAFSGAYTSGGTALQVSGVYSSPAKNVKVWGNDISQTGTYVGGQALAEGFGADLASATTITPTNAFHHITGTAAIATITAPSSRSNAYAGTFCAIPDGAFTTTTGDNIAIASTGVVGKTLCWSRDPITLKWYPSY